MRPATLASIVLVLGGCAKLREGAWPEACPEWTRDVQAVVQRECGACHGAVQALGDYRVDSYQAAVALRADGVPRVVPGDAASSLLLQAVNGTLTSHFTASPQTLERLELWVQCRAPAGHNLYHPPGWVNPSDAQQFHGTALRAAAYSTESCQRCHGADLRGGASKVDCQTCHPSGVDACSTCHGSAESPAPPESVSGLRTSSAVAVGAHRTHLTDGPLHKAYDCAVCHVVPAFANDVGHYRGSDGGLDDSPAEVSVASAPGFVSRWDRNGATCLNSQCHAPSVDTKASLQLPRWTATDAGQAACGTCHGLPPSSHVDDRCEGCHSLVYRDGGITAPELHANGIVEVGDGSGGCSACHGDATSAAPPRDLSGQTSRTLVSVGAHRKHLDASVFRGPIACSECHLIPRAPLDRGHIDTESPAEVFPSVEGVGALARADSARPVFDSTAATCSSVYCHGGGARAARDTAPGLARTPQWNDIGGSEVFCGACHGLPPRDGFHQRPQSLANCVTCHGESVVAGGGIRFTLDDAGVRSTTHLDGRVQFGAAD